MDDDRTQTREGKPKRWFADSKTLIDDYVYLWIYSYFFNIDEDEAHLFIQTAVIRGRGRTDDAVTCGS